MKHSKRGNRQECAPRVLHKRWEPSAFGNVYDSPGSESEDLTEGRSNKWG